MSTSDAHDLLPHSGDTQRTAESGEDPPRQDAGNRYLAWDGCVNVRDLGGLKTAGGTYVRRGALLRADNLCKLTAAGQQALVAHGVGTIIDLRTSAELAFAPHPFAAPATDNLPVYIHAPLLDEGNAATMSLLDSADTVTELYLLILERCAHMVRSALLAAARAPRGGVLVHCHIGKDRTGLLVAIMLGLAGVEADVIAADYALSDVYLQPVYAEILAKHAGNATVHAKLVKHQNAHAGAMLATLGFLTERYAGVEGYARQAGLEDPDIQAIRNRLLD